jgi:hypothetical protein
MQEIYEKAQKRLHFKFFFAWFDLWIGAYISTKSKAVYICPLPMIVFKFYIEEFLVCRYLDCKGERQRVAHHTGDGWGLYWSCNECGNHHDIDWHFGNEWLMPEDLQKFGYKIV